MSPALALRAAAVLLATFAAVGVASRGSAASWPWPTPGWARPGAAPRCGGCSRG
jgi:hypothetical protein